MNGVFIILCEWLQKSPEGGDEKSFKIQDLTTF